MATWFLHCQHFSWSAYHGVNPLASIGTSQKYESCKDQLWIWKLAPRYQQTAFWLSAMLRLADSGLLAKYTHYSMIPAARYACCYGRICCQAIVAEFERDAVVWDANSVTSGIDMRRYRTGAFNGVIINGFRSWFSGCASRFQLG